jgi:glycosyl transferase, family 25
MKTYVIHYDKLKGRKKKLGVQLDREKIKAEWFIQKEKEPYSKEEINKHYLFDKKEWKRRIKISGAEIIPRRLGIHEISLTINHFKIMEKIAKGKEDVALIFEDDVLITKDFNKNLKDNLKKLKNKRWDLCFLDWCNTLPPKVEKSAILNKRKDNDSWGTAAFIIKKSSIAKILKNKEKFVFCIDEEIKYLVKKLGLRVMWVNPPLTRQGSIYGKFDSTLTEDREKAGIKKWIGWRRKVYSFIRKKKLKKLADLIESMELKIKKGIIK